MKSNTPNQISSLALWFMVAVILFLIVWIGVLHRPADPSVIGGTIFVAMLALLIVSGTEPMTDSVETGMIWEVSNQALKRKHWQRVGLILVFGIALYSVLYLVNKTLAAPSPAVPLLFLIRDAIIVQRKRRQ